MKQFKTVYLHELQCMIKSKALIITTAILCVGIVVAMFIPAILDSINDSEKDSTEKNSDIYLVLDENNYIKDYAEMSAVFSGAKFQKVESKKEMNKIIEEEKAEAGFIIKSQDEFEYVVYNTSISDTNAQLFTSAMASSLAKQEINELGYDYEMIMQKLNKSIEHEVIPINTDGNNNFIFAYVLIFVLYTAVIVYGMQVASSVTAEKSNRAIEVLITSASPNALIFGKILAAITACFAQIALVGITLYGSYYFAAPTMNHMLDTFIYMPLDVVLAFAFFGTLGFILYAFLFGMCGALVSKTEELNTVSTPIMLLFVGTFMISMFCLDSPNSIILTIASYFPFSSFMTMFVRICMGTATVIEASISLGLLAITVVVIGLLTAKIYRMGTLRYGNPIKWSTALKSLKEK